MLQFKIQWDGWIIIYMHFGFGQNLDVGGTIDSVIHWDFGMRKPTCYVDEKMIAKDGKILL